MSIENYPARLTTGFYRVREKWDDPSTQVGAYRILAAGVRRELSSEVGFKGIAKKVCIFVLVGIANIVDTQVIMNGSAIRTAVIFFYLSNEGLSVLENAAVIGLPIPDKLKAMLIQLADEKKLPEDENDTVDESDE